MPGVLIIESMAQTAAVLVVETLGPDAAGKVVYFMSIEGAKFRRPVVPGDQLRIHVTKERNRGNVWKFNAVARVDGVSVAEATYAAMIMDRAVAALTRCRNQAKIFGETIGYRPIIETSGNND